MYTSFKGLFSKGKEKHSIIRRGNGSERVISNTTGITACLYTDENDPVEGENLKMRERGDNYHSKCFAVGPRDGIVPRGDIGHGQSQAIIVTGEKAETRPREAGGSLEIT